MANLKLLAKYLFTNWIHILGFFITTYLSLILFKVVGITETAAYSWENILSSFVFSIPLLFLMYGLPFIIGFYLIILIMDTVIYLFKMNFSKSVLFIQWFLISLPFIYWAFSYKYWLWCSLSFSFFITQLIRKGKIDRIQSSLSSDITQHIYF